MKIAVVVDTQVDFMHEDGALPVPGAAALAEPMARWLAALTPADTEAVLFTFDTHDRATYPQSAEALEFPIHCVRGEPGWRNVLDAGVIAPTIPCFRLEKGVFAMWEEPGLAVRPLGDPDAPGTDRDRFFADLRARSVDEAVVIGVAADYCVRWAIEGLVERGFSVEVPRALTAGITRDIDTVAAEGFGRQAVRIV